MNRKRIGPAVLVFAVMCMCLTIKEEGYAEKTYQTADSIAQMDVFQIQESANGVLLYDSVFLEPRTGPGLEYPEYLQFDLKEGTPVEVFAISSDYLGNQWVLVEGTVQGMPVRVYLLFYDAGTHEITIQKQGPWNPAEEKSLDWEYAPVFYTDAKPRMGPGDNYPLMEDFSDDSLPAVVGCEGEWALVVYYSEGIYGDDLNRGWLPINSLYIK